MAAKWREATSAPAPAAERVAAAADNAAAAGNAAAAAAAEAVSDESGPRCRSQTKTTRAKESDVVKPTCLSVVSFKNAPRLLFQRTSKEAFFVFNPVTSTGVFVIFIVAFIVVVVVVIVVVDIVVVVVIVVSVDEKKTIRCPLGF